MSKKQRRRQRNTYERTGEGRTLIRLEGPLGELLLQRKEKHDGQEAPGTAQPLLRRTLGDRLMTVLRMSGRQGPFESPSRANTQPRGKGDGRKRRRKGFRAAATDGCGPEMPLNYLRLEPTIKTVYKIAIGYQHMLVQCFNDFQHRELVYGVGRNMWGQLGRDPDDGDFYGELQPLLIDSLEKDDDIDSYTIAQIECGRHHSLLLVDCYRKVPMPPDVKKTLDGPQPLDATLKIVEDVSGSEVQIKSSEDDAEPSEK